MSLESGSGQLTQQQEQQLGREKSFNELQEVKAKAEKECLRLRRTRDELAASVLVSLSFHLRNFCFHIGNLVVGHAPSGMLAAIFQEFAHTW